MIYFKDDVRGTTGEIRQEWAVMHGATTIGSCFHLADTRTYIVRLYNGQQGEGATKEIALQNAQEQHVV